MVNTVWCGDFSNYEVKFVNLVISFDHSYMLIKDISQVLKKEDFPFLQFLGA